MPILDIITTFVKDIFSLFIAPIIHVELLWIIVPVYLNWVLTEFYQEKKGTSYGNAIANGFVALWVGIDWARATIGILTEKSIKIATVLPKTLPKLSVAALMGLYGLFIIILGMKGKRLVTYIGRIREVTYATIMLTPIFYGVVEPTWDLLLSIVVFFPIFYGVVELILHLMPTPEIYANTKKETDSFDFSSLESPVSRPTHYNPVVPDGPRAQQYQRPYQRQQF